MAERGDWVHELRERVDELIDQYRATLHDSLNELTEEEARRRLVPSKTTLLGLVKHATFVEGVWFDHAITGRSYREIGIASTVDGSFTLRSTDTVASVQASYRERWETSRSNLVGRPLEEIVVGRGERPVWALKLQVLRELAQHAGHADILREQIVASRPALTRLGQDALVNALRAGLAELADAGAAPQMQAYMKSAMPFRGVKMPARTAMVRRVLAERPLRDRSHWESTVQALWDAAEFREERYVALDLCGHRSARAWQDVDTIEMYDHFVVDGGWWDFVDTIATRLLRPLLIADRRRVEPIVRRWMVDGDMWRRRAAILVQIGARGDTDTALLADAVDANVGDTQFFIRKAIGWALREHAKRDPQWVRGFVDARLDALSPLSVREATRHIQPT